MSGYTPSGQPLQPQLMMEDIVGDYKDKTVTLEDFPFFANNIKMASVHPCKHASVMKTLLDRADAALKLRRDKLRAGQKLGNDSGMEGLVDEINKLDVSAATTADKGSGDEWEEVGNELDDQEVAIRVDQYLVVFLKVSAVVTLCDHSYPFFERGLTDTGPTVHRKCDTGYRTRFHYGCLKLTTAIETTAAECD